MDADLIRLILLGLGVCLVAGIWLWDRTQRHRGEPPMVHFRDEDDARDARDDTDWQDTDSSEHDALEEESMLAQEPEPAEPVAPLYVDHASESAEPPVMPNVLDTPASQIGDSVFHEDVVAAPTPANNARREPAWIKPAEPVIPAFLMAADSEFLDDAPAASKQTTASVTTDQRAERDSHDAAAVEQASDAKSASDPEPQSPSLSIDPDLEPELPVLELAPEPIHAPAKPRSKAKESTAKPGAEPVSIRVDEDQFDLDLGFSAVDDQDLQELAVDLPDLIVQINIVTKGEPFSGEQILAAMDQVEMRPGEHDIYHRYDNRAAKGSKPKTLFSLASLVEPGNFPLKKMHDFSSPGLTLFAQLPGPRDGLLIYSDMLYVAERLARLLDARLKDDNRSTLTKQTIEHTRERIAEHKRQITLKLRQAADQQRGRR